MAQATAKTQASAPYKRIEALPAAGALGAEIRGVDWSGEVDDETFAEVHRAWLEHQVIWFRDQDLTPDQHLAFAKRWGEIHLHPFNKPLDGYPQILEILKTEDQTQNNGGRWHTDQMYTAAPAKATTLFAREMPPYGGDTMFADMYGSYEALSDGMKRLLAGLKGVANGDSRKHPSGKGLTRMERAKAGITILPQQHMENVQTISSHPVIRTHPETGQKALYVGGHIDRFEGMTDAESEPLLKFLMDHATRPEFTCRLRWAVGTLTLWDNRCVQHFAINDYTGFRRRVHKITIKGDVPF